VGLGILEETGMTYDDRIAAVRAVNAATYPGRADFTAWSHWIRDCSQRLDAAEREHHREKLAELRRIGR